MNNGQGQHGAPSQAASSMALVPPGMVVTPEDYRLNMERIRAMKEIVAVYEQQNVEGFQRFVSQEQSLRERVEQGREAERMLAQLETVRAAQPQMFDIGGPSAVPYSLPPSTNPPNTGMPRMDPQYMYQGSARIVEVSPSHPTSPNPGQQYTQNSNFSSTNVYGPSQQPYHREQGASSSTRPVYQQHSYPTQTAQTSQQSSFTQHSGNSGQAQTAGSSQSQFMQYPQIPRHANNSNVARSDNVNMNGAPPTWTTWPNQQLPGSSQPVANSASVPYPEPQNTAQFSSAQPAPSSTAPNSAPYSVHTNEQRAMEALQNIVKTLRGLKPMTMQYIITLTVHGLNDRSLYKGPLDFSIGSRYSDEEKRNMDNISHYMIGQLKGLERNTIIRVLLSVKQQLFPGPHPQSVAAGATQPAQPVAGLPGILPSSAHGAPATTLPPSNNVAQPRPLAPKPYAAVAQAVSQPAKPPSPPVATSRPTPPPTNRSQPLTMPIPRRSTEVPISSTARPANQTASSSASASPVPRAVPAPSAPAAVPAQSAQPSAPKPAIALPRYITASQMSQNVWRANIQPRPAAPSEPGMTLKWPSSQHGSQVPSGSAVGNNHATIHIPDGSRTTPKRTATPDSLWTPAKANKARLARDIMRSLGRPAAKPSQPPTPTPQTQPSVAEPTLDTKTEAAKRKRLSESPEAAKRQRVQPVAPSDVTVDEIVTPGVVEQELETLRRREEQDVEMVEGSSLATIEARARSPLGEIPSAMSVASAPPSSVITSSEPASKVEGAAAKQEPSPEPVFEAVASTDVIEVMDSEDEAAALAAKDAELAKPSTNLPLFLPSPSSSSRTPLDAQPMVYARGESADSDPELFKSPARRKGKGRARAVPSPSRASTTMRPYVLVPPLPPYARRLKIKDTNHEWETRPAPTAKTGSLEVDELTEDDEGLEGRTKEEQAAAQLAWTRLRSMPCRWRDCSALVNSADRLRKHLEIHVEEARLAGEFSCQWEHCGRDFSTEPAELSPHVSKHALSPLFCAYEGCHRTFTTAAELLAHHNRQTPRHESLRKIPAPFVHVAEEGEVPEMPETLPSWMSVPRHVSKRPIEHEVHRWLGPRTLANISFFHCPGYRTRVSTPSRGSRRIAEKIAAVERETNDPAAALELVRRMTHDEYEFVAKDKRMPRSKRCDDLPSAEVTTMVEEGLVLWPGDGDADEWEEDVDMVEVQPEGEAGPSGISEYVSPQGDGLQPRDGFREESRVEREDTNAREDAGGSARVEAVAMEVEVAAVETKAPPAEKLVAPLTADILSNSEQPTGEDILMNDKPQGQDDQLSQPEWKTLSPDNEEDGGDTVENMLSPHMQNMSVSVS